MSDNTQDRGLADAMDSIRSIGEDWESRDTRPPIPDDDDNGNGNGNDDTAGNDTKEDDHG